MKRFDADKARALAHDALHGAGVRPYLDHALKRIEQAARQGICELAHPLSGTHLPLTNGRRIELAVEEELIRLGYRVRHVAGVGDDPREASDYTVVSW